MMAPVQEEEKLVFEAKSLGKGMYTSAILEEHAKFEAHGAFRKASMSQIARSSQDGSNLGWNLGNSMEMVKDLVDWPWVALFKKITLYLQWFFWLLVGLKALVFSMSMTAYIWCQGRVTGYNRRLLWNAFVHALRYLFPGYRAFPQ